MQLQRDICRDPQRIRRISLLRFLQSSFAGQMELCCGGIQLLTRVFASSIQTNSCSQLSIPLYTWLPTAWGPLAQPHSLLGPTPFSVLPYLLFPAHTSERLAEFSSPSSTAVAAGCLWALERCPVQGEGLGSVGFCGPHGAAFSRACSWTQSLGLWAGRYCDCSS